LETCLPSYATADRSRAGSAGDNLVGCIRERGHALNRHGCLYRQRLGSGVPVVKTIGSIQGRCKFFVRKTCQQPSKRHLGSLVSNSDGHRVGVPGAQQVSPTRKNASGLAPRLCVTGECPAGGRLENLSGKGCGRGAQGRRRPAVGYCRGWTSPLPRRFKARPWDRGAHNWERGASSVSRGNKAKAEPGADTGRNTTAFRPPERKGLVAFDLRAPHDGGAGAGDAAINDDDALSPGAASRRSQPKPPEDKGHGDAG